ncbi:MAG: histidine kinase [Bacteroidota bacterium]
MQSRLFEPLAHVLFWGLISWVIVSLFSINSQEIEIINGQRTVRITRDPNLIRFLLIGQGFAVLIAYLNILIIRKPSHLSAAYVLLRSFALLFAVVGIYLFLAKQIIFTGYPYPYYLQLGLFVFFFAISSAYGFAVEWQRSENKRQTLAYEKQQAELNLLRSQLQPHFLFNTMNNLLAMVDQSGNPKLTSAIDQLSGLLRYVVYETSGKKVTVEKEIAFIEDYTELQLLRFNEDEVNLKVNIKGDYINQKVEPGLFIPFVENAFKHGVRPEQSSFILIDFDLNQDNVIQFLCSNSLITLSGNADGGMGLKGVKKRLDLLYPEKYKLEIIKGENYIVNLKIETHEGDNR